MSEPGYRIPIKGVHFALSCTILTALVTLPGPAINLESLAIGLCILLANYTPSRYPQMAQAPQHLAPGQNSGSRDGANAMIILGCVLLFFAVLAAEEFGLCIMFGIIGLIVLWGGIWWRSSSSKGEASSFDPAAYHRQQVALDLSRRNINELARRLSLLEAWMEGRPAPPVESPSTQEMLARQRMALLEQRIKSLEASVASLHASDGTMAPGEDTVAPPAEPEVTQIPIASPLPEERPEDRVLYVDAFPTTYWCCDCGRQLSAATPGMYRCPICYTPMELAREVYQPEPGAESPIRSTLEEEELPSLARVRAEVAAEAGFSGEVPVLKGAPESEPPPEEEWEEWEESERPEDEVEELETEDDKAITETDITSDEGFEDEDEDGTYLPEATDDVAERAPGIEATSGIDDLKTGRVEPPAPLSPRSPIIQLPVPPSTPPLPRTRMEPASKPRPPMTLEEFWASNWVQRILLVILVGAFLLLANVYNHLIPDPVKALMIFAAGAGLIYAGEKVMRRYREHRKLVYSGLGLAMGGFAVLYTGANQVHFGLGLVPMEATVALTALIALANGLYGLLRRSRLAQIQALGAGHMLMGMVLYFGPGSWIDTPSDFTIAMALLTVPCIGLALASQRRSVAGVTLALLFGMAFLPLLYDPDLEGWAPMAPAVGGALLAWFFHGTSPYPVGRTPSSVMKRFIPERRPAQPMLFELTLCLALLSTTWAGPWALFLVALLFLGIWSRHHSPTFVFLMGIGTLAHGLEASASGCLGLEVLLLALTMVATVWPRKELTREELEGSWLTTTVVVMVLAMFGHPDVLTPLGPWVPLSLLLAGAWFLRTQIGSPGIQAVMSLSPWVMVSSLGDDDAAPYLMAAYGGALLAVTLYHYHIGHRPVRGPSWLPVLGLGTAYGTVLVPWCAGYGGETILGPGEAWVGLTLLLGVVIATQRHPLALMLAGLAPWILYISGEGGEQASYLLLFLTMVGAGCNVLRPWQRGGPDLKLGELSPTNVKLLASAGIQLWPHLAVLILAILSEFQRVPALEPWLCLTLLYIFIRYRWREPHHWPLALLGPWLLWAVQGITDPLATYSFLILASAQGLALLLALRGLQGRERIPKSTLWPAPLVFVNGYFALIVAARLGEMGSVLEPLGWGLWEPWLLMVIWLAVVIWTYRHPLAIGLAALMPWLLFDGGLVAEGAAYGLLALTFLPVGALYLCRLPKASVGKGPSEEEGWFLAPLSAHVAVLVLVPFDGYRIWSSMEPWLGLGLLWGLLVYRWPGAGTRTLLMIWPWLLWPLQRDDALSDYLFLLFCVGQGMALVEIRASLMSLQKGAAVDQVSLEASKEGVAQATEDDGHVPIVGLVASVAALVVLTWAGGLVELWAAGGEPWLVLLLIYALAFRWRQSFPRLELEEFTALGVSTVVALAASLLLAPTIETAEGGLLFVTVLAFLILHGLRRLEREGQVLEGLALGALLGLLVARVVVDRLPDEELTLGNMALAQSSRWLSQLGMDLVALAITTFMAYTVYRGRLGRRVGEHWHATPLLVLLPLALLCHLDLMVPLIVVPLLLWVVALMMKDHLTAPLAYVLLALNVYRLLEGADGLGVSTAAISLMVLGLFLLVLGVGLHLRSPSELPTRNNSLLGFAMTVLGMVMAWGLEPSTTAGLMMLGLLTLALRFMAQLKYLGPLYTGCFVAAVLKLFIVDLILRGTTIEALVLAMFVVAGIGLLSIHLINRFLPHAEDQIAKDENQQEG